jgi:hypothetical protein
MTGTVTLLAPGPLQARRPAALLPISSAREWWLGTVAGACLSALALVWLGQKVESSTPPEPAPAAHAAVAAAHQAAIMSNGVVELVRELPDASGGARRFELTIRLHDRTTRVSNEVGDARWRAGDKVMLLDSPA